MEQLTFNDELQKLLNSAFSVNYMVLDNFRHVDPTNHQGTFLREDIFGPKSRKQEVYENLYHDYANIRNECFKYIQEYLDSFQYPKHFRENAASIVDMYNKVCNKNVQVSDMFSSSEIKNVDFLAQISDGLETNKKLSSMERTSCYLALNSYAVFYEQYKMWLTASEIFNTLQDDITSHGSKSFQYGKPTNNNIFIIDKDSYTKFITPILVYAMADEKKLEKRRKSLVRDIKAGHKEKESELEEVLTVLVAIKLIYVSDAMINERFEAASKKPKANSKWNEIVNNILSKYVFQETEFNIDKVYVHKYEI